MYTIKNITNIYNNTNIINNKNNTYSYTSRAIANTRTTINIINIATN